MVESKSYDDIKLRELIAVLIEWINDELADQRIIVKDIEEDLYDGQVLQKLLGNKETILCFYLILSMNFLQKTHFYLLARFYAQVST